VDEDRYDVGEDNDMTRTLDSTVREIVADDFRAADVLDRFRIDFCCGGGRTLGDACRGRDLDADEVLTAVNEACTPDPIGVPRFADWDSDTLITYIIGNHHGYVRRALPAIEAHLRKLGPHAYRHPEIVEIARVFEGVSAEMMLHMVKEEAILFPYIVRMEEAARCGQPVPVPPAGSIDNPLRTMEHDHESAGAAMARIRLLSRDYAAPDDVCTTYRVCLQDLHAFERDLHAHVHLENNVLFPRARTLARSAS
jgi:regulator of cell morphogenesis and NO signaling